METNTGAEKLVAPSCDSTRCPNSGSLSLTRAAYSTFGSFKTASVSGADARLLFMQLSTGSSQWFTEVRNGY